jgi:hypothetical protein
MAGVAAAEQSKHLWPTSLLHLSAFGCKRQAVTSCRSFISACLWMQAPSGDKLLAVSAFGIWMQAPSIDKLLLVHTLENSFVSALLLGTARLCNLLADDLHITDFLSMALSKLSHNWCWHDDARVILLSGSVG